MHILAPPTKGDSVRGGLLAAACLLAVACGGDGGSPAAPSPGTTSTVSVTYPADHGTIYIGNQVQFQATDSSGGGGTQAVTGATWQSDAPAVATVSSSGLVTGVSAGGGYDIRRDPVRRTRLAAHPCLSGVPRTLGGRPERDSDNRTGRLAGIG